MGFWRKKQITFLLTTACNLTCHYCYMPKPVVLKEDRIIDIEFAKIGLEQFFSTSSSRCIRFFSPGEPTIAFKQMREIERIARDMDASTVVELETNGYFGPEIADWIEGHVDILWVSCDGPPEVHDLHRVTTTGAGSSKRVLDNIARFSKNHRMQFGIRSTVSDAFLFRQVELIEYFYNIGIRNISLMPICSSMPNKYVKSASMIDFAKGFYKAFLRAQELDMTCLTLLIVNFDEEVEVYCQALLPTPRLTPDGYVSCCDWAALGPKYLPPGVLQDMIYGRYDRASRTIQYDTSKIERIRSRTSAQLADGECKGCLALLHCAGGCVGKVASVSGSLTGINPDWCSAVLYLFERINVPQPFPVFNP